MSGRQKRDAFAVIHFGSNPIYLELELYFFKMLRQYTRNDIVYLYSVNDTPPAFVEAVRPLVTEVVSYDDRGITYDVTFKSGYANFNTLRTCNFIFAYTLEKYDKVCIIESDMVIMRNIDSVFGLRAPAALTYLVGDRNLKYNDRVRNNPREVLDKCQEMGRFNGGVMLIYPSRRLFDTYLARLQDVVQRECKYPNETLFEYVNNDYFNLPIQYNMSHFLAKGYKLADYRLSANDIVVFHFNETKFKHIDIIKNPIDEKGDNWMKIIQRDKKYDVKKLPIMHYKNTVFDKYRGVIEPMMIEAIRQPKVVQPKTEEAKPKVEEAKPKVEEPKVIEEEPKVVEPNTESKLDELRDASPLTAPPGPNPSPTPLQEEAPLPEEVPIIESKVHRKKCPKGTRKNRRTGVCEPKVESKVVPTFVPAVVVPVKKERLRCPNGSRRNRRTGLCSRKK
jgi:lipopolysaccharide biosynthesis glycosyltransferase